MAQLIKIGNSQGIRIQKALIEQAHLEGKELALEVITGEGILVRPLDIPRVGWAEKIQATLIAKGQEVLDHEWLDAALTDETWTWK